MLRAVCCTAAVLAGSVGLLFGVTKPAPRIGVVAIQDHEGRSLGFQALNNRLLQLLRNAGYRPVALEFQPSADVEHAARQLGCTHILYTDIVEVRKSAAPQIATALHSVAATNDGKHRDIWEAEVEFRLFAIDQVQALLSSSVNGKNQKHSPTTAPAELVTVSNSGSLTRPEPDMLAAATPVEEPGRLKKHKTVAVATALERETKLLKSYFDRPPAGEKE